MMIRLKSLNFGLFDRGTKTYRGSEMLPTISPDFRNLEANELLIYYQVKSWQEMRIDLVLNDVYGETEAARECVDIILSINGIDNPLNIKAGMILKLPESLDDIDSFRYVETNFKEEAPDAKAILGKPNKNTRVDAKRKAFIENNYSLPPTVNKSPIPPVRYEEGNAVFGGVK